MLFNTNVTHLQAQITFLLVDNRVVLLSSFHNYIITDVCISFDHACSQFGNVVVLFPYD